MLREEIVVVDIHNYSTAAVVVVDTFVDGNLVD